MNSLLTFIVPVYKIKEAFLRRCIESLVSQKSQISYDIILIDDGSPDNCGHICDEYAEKISKIKVIHQSNQGVSEARNSGMREVKTKWFTFVDADDWIDSDYIESIAQILDNPDFNAEIIMFDYSRQFVSHENPESLNRQEGMLATSDIDKCRNAIFYKLMQNGKINPYTVIAIWNKIYNTEFINNNKITFLKEARKGQDRIFNAEVFCLVKNAYYLNKKLYYYRCWGESRTNRFDSNIVNLTKIEVNSLLDICKKYNLSSEVYRLLNCRICTRLYSCMRLYYFNSQNEKPQKEQVNEVRSLIKLEPFVSALKSIDMSLLSAQEKIFIFCIKHNLYGLCRLLVLAKDRSFARKLF